MSEDRIERSLRKSKVIIEHEDRLSVLEKYGIYKTLDDLKNASANTGSPYTLLTNDGRAEYNYILGNFSNQADDVNFIKLNNISLEIGALVRQNSKTITFIQPNGQARPRSLNDKLGEVVSVGDYGIITGLNDTDTLNRALATGKTVKIPAGFTVQTFSDVILQPGQSIIGDGYLSKLYLQSNNQQNNIKVKMGDNSSVSGLRIVEIGATGRNGVYGTVFADSVSNCTVDDVDISGSSSTGIMFINSTNIKVSSCTVHDTKADGIHFQRGCKRIIVSDCHVYRVSDDGIAFVSHGYDQYGPVMTAEVSNCIISDVQSIGSGIGIIGAFNITVSGCKIDNTPLSGIRISSANFPNEGSCVSGKIKVTGTSISNTGVGPQINNNGGIFVEGARYVDITDNSIFSPSSWGIATSNAVVDLSIRDNLIVGGGDAGIFLSFAAQTGYYLQIWNRIDLSDGTNLPYTAGHNVSVRGNRIRSPAKSGIYHVGDTTRRTDRLTIRDNDLYRIKADPSPGSAYGIFVTYADNIKIGGNDIHAANGLTLDQFVDPATTSGSQGLENSTIPRKTGFSWDAVTWLGNIRHYYHSRPPVKADASTYGTFPAGTVIWNINPANGILLWVITADITSTNEGSVRKVESIV